jgi:DNA polymerase I-like protein with 3'-5' exonuclease and polymerase domains
MVTTTLKNNTGMVGLDLETTGLDPRRDRVRLLSLSIDTVDGGTFAYLVDCFAVDPSPLWEALAERELVLHNAAFDLAFLARLGFTPTGRVRDTMLLAQLLTAGTMEKVNLGACCRRWLNRQVDKAEQKSDWTGELTGDQLSYAATDVEVLVPLLKVQAGKITEANLIDAAKIELRCLLALVWMGRQGVALDRGEWHSLATAADEEAKRLRQELDQVGPKNSGELFDGWNWDSTQQAQKALNLAGCKVEDTADETLAAIDHPLAQLLRQYRLVQKRGSTFGVDWQTDVEKFQQHVRRAYQACAQAVNEELSRSNGHHPVPAQNSPHANGNGHAASNGTGNGQSNGQRRATTSQVKAIFGIARNQRIDVGQLMGRYGVNKPEDLDIKTASKVIESLKAQEGRPS